MREGGFPCIVSHASIKHTLLPSERNSETMQKGIHCPSHHRRVLITSSFPLSYILDLRTWSPKQSPEPATPLPWRFRCMAVGLCTSRSKLPALSKHSRSGWPRLESRTGSTMELFSHYIQNATVSHEFLLFSNSFSPKLHYRWDVDPSP